MKAWCAAYPYLNSLRSWPGVQQPLAALQPFVPSSAVGIARLWTSLDIHTESTRQPTDIKLTSALLHIHCRLGHVLPPNTANHSTPSHLVQNAMKSSAFLCASSASLCLLSSAAIFSACRCGDKSVGVEKLPIDYSVIVQPVTRFTSTAICCTTLGFRLNKHIYGQVHMINLSLACFMCRCAQVLPRVHSCTRSLSCKDHHPGHPHDSHDCAASHSFSQVSPSPTGPPLVAFPPLGPCPGEPALLHLESAEPPWRSSDSTTDSDCECGMM